MKPIIEVNQVWKAFQKGKDRRYKSLRDTLTNLPKNIFNNANQEEFYALEDISFNVNAGESLGIIGRNGAGKSTLLKILSRITPPTKGEIILRGRVASLLEVGTGFHPELTGRENIYFNGSILGMRYHEIKRHFDEIVDFSGVESFLDTPLKHFSSGMQMRLAFSVAAHLNAEILLIDEVLAVGDVEFQKKCIGKMDDVSREQGKTIIFVSHNLESIKQLCNKGIYLNKNIELISDSLDIVFSKYLESTERKNFYENSVAFADKPYFLNVVLLNPEIKSGDDLDISITINSPFDVNIGIEIEIKDIMGTPISYSSTAPMQGKLSKLSIGKNNFKLKLLNLKIASGKYEIQMHLIEPWKQQYDVIRNNLYFDVTFSDPFNSGFNFLQNYRRGSFYHEIENLKL